MSNFTSIIACIFIALLGLELSKAQDMYNEPRDQALKYCGSKLSDMMQIVCGGVFNSLFKRSGVEVEIPSSNERRPFRMKEWAKALDLEKRAKLLRRQVHNECCVKSCKITEMLDYCQYAQ